MDRKKLKKEAKQVLKKHYLLFVLICVIVAFIGTGINNSFTFITGYNMHTLSYTDESSVNNEENTYDEGDFESINVISERMDLFSVIQRFKNGEEKQIKEETENQTRLVETHTTRPLGRSDGVFAKILNSVTSGSLYVTIVSGIISLIGSANIALMILTFISILIMLCVWFFIKNIIDVVEKRFFLEGRIYNDVPVTRFLFLYKTGSWVKASWTMFVKYVFSVLWTLTIIGGIIKHYSYALVPYIVAENPKMKALDAITLSRKMMDGHKFEMFILDLSFLGWMILNLFSLGFINIFFLDPYRTAVYSEYYVYLRKLAHDNNIPGSDSLADTYLYEYADDSLLEETYSDVLAILNKPVNEIKPLNGFWGIISKLFGIVPFHSKEQEAYDKAQIERLRIRSLEKAYNKESYPRRLSVLEERTKKKKHSDVLYYTRSYSIWSLVLMFFIFSFIGWLWEVALHLVSDGVFVNRGVLHGPWLPIYGTGALLILVVLNKLRKYPVAEFIAAIVLCGIVEYFTAYTLELTHNGMKWWDYSGYFLNLDGRICAEGLLIFGLGGVAVVYLIAPLLDNLIKNIPFVSLIVICVVLLSVYICDTVYSQKHPNMGAGISSMAQEELNSSMEDRSIDCILSYNYSDNLKVD